MFNFIGNTIILTIDANVDDPVNRRLVDLVLGTCQAFLNSLIPPGALVAGTVEFREDENPTTDLADGIVRFHLTLTPPSPGESLEFVLEYDPDALDELFA
jgi:phage tail sheath protein FI